MDRRSECPEKCKGVHNSTKKKKENKENQKKEEKNLEATLLIEPNNEEAILMTMKIALEKSNYSRVKELSNKFIKVCKKLCDENNSIVEALKSIEPKNNES